MNQASYNEFLCSYEQLITQLNAISAQRYIANRNYLSGDVTRLSPFITHGILNTRVLAAAALKGLSDKQEIKTLEKFIFQLAWRDFFHRVWQNKGDDIFTSLTTSQLDYGNVRSQIPVAILNAATGINAIDEALSKLYSTGYIHNHERMWLAFMVANLSNTDWYVGAKWMNYHLLDGDLASNTLSWQWVAGTFSKKQYIANQENLNKYAPISAQKDTVIDVSYEELQALQTPKVLLARTSSNIKHTDLGLLDHEALSSQTQYESDTIFLRSIYHLDPHWQQEETGEHIILIEPAWLERFPLSPNRLLFMKHWIDQITAIQSNKVRIILGDFSTFVKTMPATKRLVFQRHNTCQHWIFSQTDDSLKAAPQNDMSKASITVEDYPWLFAGLEGDYSSFFSFWKHAKKQLYKPQWLEGLYGDSGSEQKTIHRIKSSAKNDINSSTKRESDYAI